MDMAKVVSVNISKEKGTIKEAVPKICIDANGIEGDAHAGPWHRQVSLLAKENLDGFSDQMDRAFAYGEFAENITTEGIDLSQVAIRDSLRIGEVVLEVSQLGKKCHGDGCAIFREVGQCVMPKAGIFARVLTGGSVEPGQAIEWIQRPLKIQIITLSDRAAAGVYTDRSGPRVETLLADHFKETRWHLQILRDVIPDEPSALEDLIKKAVTDEADIILTLGSTGVGPRDIAPEIVESTCDKLIPGVMEFIRVKYGETIPSARLSRSVAGLIGQTQIYTLPGSVRAVDQYMEEILKTVEHTIFMVCGLDVH
jgi:molybdopterin adenylyltransferase